MKAKRELNLQKAVKALQAQDGDKVVDICRKLLKKDPQNFDVLHLMGVGYKLLRNNRRALDYYVKALKAQAAGSATLYCNLAFAYLEVREESNFKASKYAEKAVAIAPTLVESHEVSADVNFRTGDCFAAENSFTQALTLSPNNPRLLRKLARSYRESERFDDALDTIRAALAIAPGDYAICEEYADILEKRGDTDLALAAYEELKLHEDANPVWIDQRIIGMLSTHGRPAEVESRALQLIETHWNLVPPHLSLIRAGNYPGGVEAGIEVVESLMRGKHFRLLEDFAIADGFDKEKNYDQSFKYYLSANRKKREREVSRYKNLNVTLQHHNNIKDVFIGDLHQKMTPRDDLDEFPTPIFVLGMPRSGTSLTEQLLGMHTKIHPAGELGFLPRLIKYGHGTYNDFPGQRKKEHWDRVRDVYLKCIQNIGNGAPFVIDKMPHNFEHVGFIRKLFPNAVVIHTFRDPISNCLSLFRANFGGWHPYAQDLRLLGQYYAEYQKLMRFWEGYFGDDIYQSRYEDLVDDMRTAVTEMLDRCNLEWEDEIEGFHSVDRIVRTASNDQVRKPIYKSSKKSWTNYEEQLQPLIESLMTAGAITEADLA